MIPAFCGYNESSGEVRESGAGRLITQSAADAWTSPPGWILRIFNPRGRINLPGAIEGAGEEAVFLLAPGVELVDSPAEIADAGGKVVGGEVSRSGPISIAEELIVAAIQNLPPAQARDRGVAVMKRLARRYIQTVRRALSLDDSDPDFADPEDLARIQALKDALRPIIVAASQATTIPEFRAQWDALVSITGDEF